MPPSAPDRDERERRRSIIKRVAAACRPRIDVATLASLSRAQADVAVMNSIRAALKQEYPMLPKLENDWLVPRILDMIRYLGPLTPLLEDDTVSDITVNGLDDVWVDRGAGLVRENAWFVDDEEVRQVVEKLLGRGERRIDEASPLVDARLPSGERVNIIISPLAVSGTAITIRRFPRAFTPDELVASGTFESPLLHLLSGCVRSRANLVISGGAGSGKTTLLNALTTFIPERERVITIEDVSELAVFRRRDNVVALESRPAGVEGTGDVPIRALVRNALRMRPDRIVVGEVRGPETLDMLQAMNTGHDGSITTVHANSTGDVVPRLLTLAAMTELNLSSDVLRAQVLTAVDVILQLARDRDGLRRVEAVAATSGIGDSAQLQPVARFDPDPHDPRGGSYEYSALPERLTDRFRRAGIAPPPEFA